jgi:flagellar biosynthesis protein FlhG
VNRFLPVALTHVGNIPHDDRLARSVKRQQPVVAAFPRSPAALALKRLAERVDAWSTPTEARGGVEFFVERFMRSELAKAAR